jgi:polyvinyl alcohol dehydrogenase (cytochrome)
MDGRSWISAIIAAGLLALAAQAQAADHPGKAVYDAHCAACHNPRGVPRAPPPATLHGMGADTLRAALTTGVMKAQGSGLTRDELDAVVDWLGVKGPANPSAWLDRTLCPADRRPVNLSGRKALARFGVDDRNTRHMTAAQAGLRTADLANLEVAWVLGFPGTTDLRAQGVIIGQTLFYAAGQTGYVLALDTRAGCARWAYRAGPGVRTSLSYGPLGAQGPKALVFGDGAGQVHAVDAATGRLIWKAEGRHDPNTMLTGAPILHGDRVIVPVSAFDVARAMSPQFECCKAHGAVVALDAATGRRLWVAHTMPDAAPNGRKSSVGTTLYGPSGAPIWSSPAFDDRRGLIFVGTGENTSAPATATSDSIWAIDLATGKTRWNFQGLENDIYNMACNGPHGAGPNCPDPRESVIKDYDFGASMVLGSGPGGRELVIGGQKSGDVWALDAATGKLVWHDRFGEGSALGGVHWGMASDGTRLFVPIAHMPPGLNAIDIVTGKVAWHWAADTDCAGQPATSGCGWLSGLSAAPLAIDNAVVAAALDGKVRIFDALTGRILATYDTARDYPSPNGVPTRGGAIDAHSVFAGDGALFIGSGYGMFGQPPGNALVALRAKGKR